jgi:hypothetical protein
MITAVIESQRANPPERTTYAVIRDYEVMLSFPAQSNQMDESLCWGMLSATLARYSRRQTVHIIGSSGRISTTDTGHPAPTLAQSRGLAALSVDIRQRDTPVIRSLELGRARTSTTAAPGPDIRQKDSRTARSSPGTYIVHRSLRAHRTVIFDTTHLALPLAPTVSPQRQRRLESLT